MKYYAEVQRLYAAILVVLAGQTPARRVADVVASLNEGGISITARILNKRFDPSP